MDGGAWPWGSKESVATERLTRPLSFLSHTVFQVLDFEASVHRHPALCSLPTTQPSPVPSQNHGKSEDWRIQATWILLLYFRNSSATAMGEPDVQKDA